MRLSGHLALALIFSIFCLLRRNTLAVDTWCGKAYRPRFNSLRRMLRCIFSKAKLGTLQWRSLWPWRTCHTTRKIAFAVTRPPDPSAYTAISWNGWYWHFDRWCFGKRSFQHHGNAALSSYMLVVDILFPRSALQRCHLRRTARRRSRNTFQCYRV